MGLDCTNSEKRASSADAKMEKLYAGKGGKDSFCKY